MKRMLATTRSDLPRHMAQETADALGPSLHALPDEVLAKIMYTLPAQDYLSQRSLSRVNRQCNGALGPILRATYVLARQLHAQQAKEGMDEDDYYTYLPLDPAPHQYKLDCDRRIARELQAVRAAHPAHKLSMLGAMVDAFCDMTREQPGLSTAYLEAWINETGTISLVSQPAADIALVKVKALVRLARVLGTICHDEALRWRTTDALVLACRDLRREDSERVYAACRPDPQSADAAALNTRAVNGTMLCALFLETSEQKRVCCLELLEQIAGSDDCKEKAAMLMAFERTLARVLQQPDRSAVQSALDRTVEAFWTTLEARTYDADGEEWDDGLHEIAWDWFILQRPESERWNTWMALLAASSRASADRRIVFLESAARGLSALTDSRNRGLFAEAICDAACARPVELASRVNFEASMHRIAVDLPAGRLLQRYASLLRDFDYLAGKAYDQRLGLLGVLATMLPEVPDTEQRSLLWDHLMRGGMSIFDGAELEEIEELLALYNVVQMRMTGCFRHVADDMRRPFGLTRVMDFVESLPEETRYASAAIDALHAVWKTLVHPDEQQMYLDAMLHTLTQTRHVYRLESVLALARSHMHDADHRLRICKAFALRLKQKPELEAECADAMRLGLVALLPECGDDIACMIPGLFQMAKSKALPAEDREALIAKLAGYVSLLPAEQQEKAFFWLFNAYNKSGFTHMDAMELVIQRLADSLPQLHDPATRGLAAYTLVQHTRHIDLSPSARLLVRMVKGLATLRDCAEQKERILLFASAAARMEAYPRKRILFEMARVLLKMEDDEAARDLWAAVNQVLAAR